LNITLQNTGKRFNREWIFRKFNYEFLQGRSYAITGANGSGKSTLLQVIAGAVMQSEGSVEYASRVDDGRWTMDDGRLTTDDRPPATNNYNLPTGKTQLPTANCQLPTDNSPLATRLSPESSFRHISIAAPYLELIEEMTGNELLAFHDTFKPLKLPAAEILQAVGLQKAGNKQIRYYSSGMKQRLKLAQAFFSNTSVLLLDEPVTNLDEDGIAVYKNLLQQHTANRLVIVSSNDKQEYDFCEERIAIGDYK
jgi:ABC-2 type transport system ATP-binding protein